jgi:HSP20 family protein
MPNETTIEKRQTQQSQPERLRGGLAFVPSVDIVEERDKLLLLADMPGVRPGDLDITYERGTLTVHGRVAPRQDLEQTNYLLREYGVGDFCRSFHIGEGIDASKIEAELHDGVLTLHLPKSQELLPRKIALKLS